jgi:hypothetical protein
MISVHAAKYVRHRIQVVRKLRLVIPPIRSRSLSMTIVQIQQNQLAEESISFIALHVSEEVAQAWALEISPSCLELKAFDIDSLEDFQRERIVMRASLLAHCDAFPPARRLRWGSG